MKELIQELVRLLNGSAAGREVWDVPTASHHGRDWLYSIHLNGKVITFYDGKERYEAVLGGVVYGYLLGRWEERLTWEET